MMNNENLFKLYEIINRQALHAITLGFLHPKSNKKLFFESGLPSDINNLRNFLKDLQKIQIIFDFLYRFWQKINYINYICMYRIKPL